MSTDLPHYSVGVVDGLVQITTFFLCRNINIEGCGEIIYDKAKRVPVVYSPVGGYNASTRKVAKREPRRIKREILTYNGSICR